MKSLAQLIGLATAIFDKNSELKKLYATEDGQFFVDENRANLHANSPKKEGGKVMKVYPITRSDAVKTQKKTEKKTKVQKKTAVKTQKAKEVETKEQPKAKAEAEKDTKTKEQTPKK